MNDERDMIIDDLAEDVIRVMYMPIMDRMCDVCQHFGRTGYVVWVQLPSTVVDNESSWNKWGRCCWHCMALLVGAGGTPITVMASDH